MDIWIKVIDLEIMFFVHLYIVFTSFSTITSNPVCQVALTNDFNTCNNRAAELFDFSNYDINRIFNTSQTKNPIKDCFQESICRHIFQVARIRRQSFAEKTLVRISDMLFKCCGQCAKYYRTDLYSSLPSLNFTELNSFDLIFPILGRQSDKELYGFHYIPVFQIPNAYYLTLRKSKEDLANDLMMSCFKLWPMTIISLCLSFIAGFIIWVIESYTGNEQFPKVFISGMACSFWWSFITVTTVGYGDTYPKNIFGRVFTIVWICIGVVVMAIFVASLSSEILIHNVSDRSEIKGRLIGVLKDHLHEAILVSQHGGDFFALEHNSTVDGIGELMKMLTSKKIDGIVVNKATYFYFKQVILENSLYKNLYSFVEKAEIQRFEKAYINQDFVTGLLVKHRHHYDFFKGYFQSNWLQIQSCYEYSLNYKDVDFVQQIGHHGLEGLFEPFITWILVIIACIIVFGVVYEVRRRKEQKDKGSASSFEQMSQM